MFPKAVSAYVALGDGHSGRCIAEQRRGRGRGVAACGTSAATLVTATEAPAAPAAAAAAAARAKALVCFLRRSACALIVEISYALVIPCPSLCPAISTSPLSRQRANRFARR
jgi:hypothetical protein